MHNSDSLPRWDMTTVYPDLASPEFAAEFQADVEAIDALLALFDAHAIMLRAEPLPVDADAIATFETILERYNAVREQANTLHAHLSCYNAIESRNEQAQSWYSQFQRQYTRLAMAETRLAAWLGSLDIEALIAASPIARTHAHALHRAGIIAKHLMSPAEEALAAELKLTGGGAWTKLYNAYSSQISVEVALPGAARRLPMTAVRNLAFDADRAVRRAAYEAELAAWQQHALPIAAAMNGIKGEMLTLTQKRGWESPLEVGLFENAIDRETLEVMLATAREFFPDFRRYLKAKAGALGLPVLAWYDLFAPLSAAGEQWDFAKARAFIIEKFGTYSPALAGLAQRAFAEGWIDAEPRDGKRGGAFCQWLRKDESRILANFQPAYGGVATLAHELGHAYHNLHRARRTYLQRQTPMTLAETASNFCETIIREAALAQATPQEQLAILEASLQDSLQVTVDITSRFTFERAVFEQRAARELTVEEFKDLMLAAQRDAYGDGLDPDALHPFMWAVKPHYYSSVFYNFPYMFGLLFSLGLYARYRAAPDDFKSGYDELLAATGMADAASLAARFDIDVRSADFWRSSLALIRADIDRFEALVASK